MAKARGISLVNKTTVTDPKGSIFKLLYNNNGLLSEEITPFEENNNQVKKYTYDSNGNTLSTSITTNKPGEAETNTITKYTYDRMNRATTTETGGVVTRVCI